MADIDETRLNGIESRVTKIEECTKHKKETEKQQWRAGVEKKLEDIEKHLKQQDKEMAKAKWSALAAVGAAVTLLGVSFLVLMKFEEDPWGYIGFLIVAGFVIMIVFAIKECKVN